MAGGGIFIAGGLAQRPFIKEMVITHIYNDYLQDAHMREVLKSFPLYLVGREDLGLLGARERARRGCV